MLASRAGPERKAQDQSMIIEQRNLETNAALFAHIAPLLLSVAEPRPNDQPQPGDRPQRSPLAVVSGVEGLHQKLPLVRAAMQRTLGKQTLAGLSDSGITVQHVLEAMVSDTPELDRQIHNAQTRLAELRPAIAELPCVETQSVPELMQCMVVAATKAKAVFDAYVDSMGLDPNTTNFDDIVRLVKDARSIEHRTQRLQTDNQELEKEIRRKQRQQRELDGKLSAMAAKLNAAQDRLDVIKQAIDEERARHETFLEGYTAKVRGVAEEIRSSWRDASAPQQDKRQQQNAAMVIGSAIMATGLGSATDRNLNEEWSRLVQELQQLQEPQQPQEPGLDSQAGPVDPTAPSFVPRVLKRLQHARAQCAETAQVLQSRDMLALHSVLATATNEPANVQSSSHAQLVEASLRRAQKIIERLSLAEKAVQQCVEGSLSKIPKANRNVDEKQVDDDSAATITLTIQPTPEYVEALFGENRTIEEHLDALATLKHREAQRRTKLDALAEHIAHLKQERRTGEQQRQDLQKDLDVMRRDITNTKQARNELKTAVVEQARTLAEEIRPLVDRLPANQKTKIVAGLQAVVREDTGAIRSYALWRQQLDQLLGMS